MANFRYIGKDKQGFKVMGIIDAADEAQALATLRGKDFIIISIKEEHARRVAAARRVKLEDLVIFSRQLATMVDSGIPLVQALNILSEQIEKEGFRQVIVKVRQDIEAGSSFCDSLGKHSTVFSPLYINMVKAGEASGLLNDILDRLASYLESVISLQRKVSSSLVYPAVVITMAILITAFLLLKIIPTFKGIFEVLGGTLPLPTQILIGISDFLRKFFLFWLGLTIVSVIAFQKYVATPKGRYQFDKTILKMPVFGELFRKVAIARFSRTLSTLIKSGVPILNSMDIVAKTSGNKIVEEAIQNARSSIKEGEPISGPLSRSGVFPPMVVRMISVGEQTGELEKMLSKISDFYDEQIDAAVSGLTSMIEPLVIAFLGIVIGGIVVALFLPIFKITQLVAH
ncbi:MAG: type II secretion system F family protein [Candidatus Omnitrophota bacterium]